MDLTQLLIALGGLAMGLLIGWLIWLLNAPSRRRFGQLERDLDAANRRLADVSGNPPRNEASEPVPEEPLAEVIELRPGTNELNEELATALVRVGILEDRLDEARSAIEEEKEATEAAETRWRTALEVNDSLRRELARAEDRLADAHLGIEEIRTQLTQVGSITLPDVIDLREEADGESIVVDRAMLSESRDDRPDAVIEDPVDVDLDGPAGGPAREPSTPEPGPTPAPMEPAPTTAPTGNLEDRELAGQVGSLQDEVARLRKRVADRAVEVATLQEAVDKHRAASRRLDQLVDELDDLRRNLPADDGGS